MSGKRHFWVGLIALIVSSLMVSGCAVNFYRQSPRSRKKIKDLKVKIDDLEAQRLDERRRFEEVKLMLEKKLRQQISDRSVSLKMDDRGLVITLSDDILFDSGKAEIKKNAYPVLDKVTKIIIKEVPNKNIGIGGHTDNVPIKYSGWKSNWELSTARATNVLHYLSKKGVPVRRLSAIGYGEHHPIASNKEKVGRARNRRVEIVILPEFEKKTAADRKQVKGRGQKPSKKQADTARSTGSNFAKTKEKFIK